MIRKALVLSLLAISSSSVFAGGHVWNFSNLGINSTGNGYQHTVSSGNGMDVTISAWSSTGSGCEVVSGNYSSSDYDSCIQSAKIRSYSGGLGVINRDEVDNGYDHSIDNSNRYNRYNSDLDFDMVLFSFDEAVKIDGFNTGWVGGDWDMSVAAYTGNTPFMSSSFSNTSWAGILNKGWSTIDGQNADRYSRDFVVDDKDVYSKHWLVGTYNSSLDDLGWTDFNDAFKLHSLSVVNKLTTTGNSQGVSAPATASILFGLVGFMLVKRKRNKIVV